MTVSTIDAYGAPNYGPIGTPPAGIVFHTPENVDHTLTQAVAVAKWQASSANTSGGSYHGILGYDQSRGNMDNPDAWVMVRSVPWNKAAGGLSTRRDSVWAPQRYPWIQQLLPKAAFADPNKWMHQISLSGKAAWYTEHGYPRGAVIRLAEWVKILEDAYKYNAVMTLHRHWQTNRSDPGPLNLADLVLEEYNKLNAPTQPEPTIPPDPQAIEIANLNNRLALKNTDIDAAIAALQRAKGR